MSRDHVSLVRMHSSHDVEVYRVCESETMSMNGEVTLAIAVLDKCKCDISIVPCGPWSGARVIDSVQELFGSSKVEVGHMPPAPYGGKRMLYLMAESKAMLAKSANS